MLTLTLPALVTVDDYHEFSRMQEHFSFITQGGKIKIEEIGFGCDGRFSNYVGVAYTGRKPSAKIIAELLKAKKVTLDE